MIPLTALTIGLFITVILINLVNRNDTVVSLFQAASLLVVVALLQLGYAEGAYGLMVAGVLSLLVKGVLAPYFLRRQIVRYESFFAPATYLRIPMTLVVLAILTAFAHFMVYANTPIATDKAMAMILLASIFGMCFFMINRTGTLAQIIGILSIENSIVLFTVLLGVAHSVALEVAIAFDLLVWIAIATTFLTLIYRQFGSLEHAPMSHLKEE